MPPTTRPFAPHPNNTPLTYTQWVTKGKKLFDDGAPVTVTRTYEYDANANPPLRYASGFTSKTACWFYVTMDAAEEVEFWAAHTAWVGKPANSGGNHAKATLGIPPACGTPNTPVCPPPPLEAAIEALAEKIAGPTGSVEDARIVVEDMLMATLESASALVKLVKK